MNNIEWAVVNFGKLSFEFSRRNSLLGYLVLHFVEELSLN